MKKSILIFIWLLSSLYYNLNAELRLLEISEPGNFKADTGRFSDAYYVMTEAPVEVKALIYNDGNDYVTNARVRIRINQELSDGSFNGKSFLEKEIYYNIGSKEKLEINFDLASGEGEKFFPLPYYNILCYDSTYNYPKYFSKMKVNVTPRYKISIEAYGSDGKIRISSSKIVRFYFPRTDYLLSVENASIGLDSNSSKDQIAGKLNADSLIKNFDNIFDSFEYKDPFKFHDILDRTGWEPQSIDYSFFNYLLWADGDDKPISKPERKNIMNFLDGGCTDKRKNIIICSQELAREHGVGGIKPDSIFLSSYLRTINCPPGNPKGKGVNCNGILIQGYAIGRNKKEQIISTEFKNDIPPLCGLVTLSKNGEGLAKGTANYFPDSIYNKNSYAGVCVATLKKRQIYYAVDWRHFMDVESIIIDGLDYWDFQNVTPLKYSFDVHYSKSRLKPLDTLTIDLHYYYIYYNNQWNKYEYLPMSNIKFDIMDPLNKSITSVITDTGGRALYNIIIPYNCVPGAYKLFFKKDTIELSHINVIIEKPTFEILGKSQFCENQLITYSFNNFLYERYNWQVAGGKIITYNSDSSEINILWGAKGNGKVSLELFKEGATKEIELPVTIYPIPEKPVISQIYNKLVSSQSLGIQWYLNGELIEGATGQVYEPIKDGNYTATSTNSYGCSSDTSQPYYFKKIETEIVEQNIVGNDGKINISPNPASDFIEINVGAHCNVPLQEIKIFNTLGECMRIVEVHCNEPLRIDVSNLPSGVYFLKVGDEVLKFVKF